MPSRRSRKNSDPHGASVPCFSPRSPSAPAAGHPLPAPVLLQARSNPRCCLGSRLKISRAPRETQHFAALRTVTGSGSFQFRVRSTPTPSGSPVATAAVSSAQITNIRRNRDPPTKALSELRSPACFVLAAAATQGLWWTGRESNPCPYAAHCASSTATTNFQGARPADRAASTSRRTSHRRIISRRVPEERGLDALDSPRANAVPKRRGHTAPAFRAHRQSGGRGSEP